VLACWLSCTVIAVAASSMSALIDLTTESGDHGCCHHDAAAATAREPSDDEAAPPAKRKKTGMRGALRLLQHVAPVAFDAVVDSARITALPPGSCMPIREIKICQIVPLVHEPRLTTPLSRRQSGQADEGKARETRGRNRENSSLQSAGIAEGAGKDPAGAAR